MAPESSAGSSSPLTAEIKAYIERYCERYGVPGVSLALVWRDKEEDEWQSETYCRGIATVKGDKVDPDTIFCIASNSKVITSICIGLLIDRKTKLPNGKELAWDTKVKDALPEYELEDKYAQDHVTIVDLLSHMSGLPRHDILLKNDDTTSRVVAALKHVKPCRELRQGFQYANVNYYTAGEIIVRLSGAASFPDFVKQNLLDPLGMSSSMYDGAAAAKTGKRADGYGHVGKDKVGAAKKIKQGEWDPSAVGKTATFGWFSDGTGDVNFAPAGSLSTTANDMAKWMRELMDPKIIPEDVWKEINKPRVVSSASTPAPEFSSETYGLGQALQTYRGQNTEGHGGGLSGFTSKSTRLPGRMGVMVMSNDGELGYSLGAYVGYRLVDQVCGLEPMEWEEKILWKELSTVKEYDARPDSPRKAEKIAGNYWHDGYESLDIRPLEQSEVKEDLEKLLQADPLRTIPLPKDGLHIAKTDKLLESHLILAPFDGPIYRWVRVYIRTLLEPADGHTHLVEVWADGKAVVTPNGIGMFEGFWGLLDPVPKQEVVEEGVEQEAEVWFARKE